MTPDDRAVALQSLGYTPRQAAFLALVAVHGGYFLRRQYAAFLGRPDGGVVTDLLRRVVAWGHATRQTVARDTHLYHLAARTIYAVLGEPQSRYRRPALPPTIAVRLLTLDLVLDALDRPVLATEADKLRYFTETWALPMSALPSATYRSTGRDPHPVVHYFDDHLPILLAPDSPEVTLLYVQGWSRGVGGFETVLRRYRPLIDRLSTVRVRYVTTRSGLVALAERAWADVCGDGARRPAEAPTPEHLGAHFRLRRRVEQAGLWTLTADERTEWRSGERRFAGAQWQLWYERWRTSGDVVLEAWRRPVMPTRLGSPPRFDALVVRRWYPLFSPLEARHDTHQSAA